MAWMEVNKDFARYDEPKVTLRNTSFVFNKAFALKAELDKSTYIRFYIDERLYRIAFEFTKEANEKIYKLNGNKSQGYYCSSYKMYKIPWIKRVAEEKKDNVLTPSLEEGKYIIYLRPSFELSVSRKEAIRLSSDDVGIYRYVDNGNIVYIGCGYIKKRLKDLTREDWVFDTIEYSIVEDKEFRYEIERYWLDRFKDNNNGKLPSYNLINGRSS